MMKFAFLLLGAMLVVGCDSRPAQWDAYVYPGDDLIEVEKIRGFKTFELCQAAAVGRLQSLRSDGGGSYECGYKCEPLSAAGDMELCEETRK